MKSKIVLLFLSVICAFSMKAQILTTEYVALADSADQYIKKENWEKAEYYIRKALKQEPANKSNYLLWANLGMVCTNRNDLPGAVQAYSIGLATAPRSTTLLTNRGSAYLAMGYYAEALADLDLALEVDSTLTRARKFRALTHASLRHNQEAISDIEIYTKGNGEEADLMNIKGDLLINLNQPEEALSCYKRAYELEPDEESAVKYLNAAYLTGKLEEESLELDKAIRKYERSGNLYLLRAALHRMKYQTTAMESDLKTARSLGCDKLLESIICR